MIVALRTVIIVWPRMALRAGVVQGSVGLAALLAIWQLLSWLMVFDPDLVAFAEMAPRHALPELAAAVADGSLFVHLTASLGRVGAGLALAGVVGVALGVAVGLIGRLRTVTHIPFQLLRMVSPLAWMPVAIIAFDTWDGAIIFIISAAALWPVLFAVAGAIRRFNPEWFELAVNLGAGRFAMLRDFVLPAIAQDVFAGLRQALGVAWIVLVPAELLGVTSGLGYSLNDARDALEYDRLAAMVLAIGIVGLALDTIMHMLVRRWAWHATS